MNVSKAYLLTFQQFLVLLHGKKITDLIIFEELQQTVVNEKEIIQTISTLMVQGIVKNVEEEYVLNDEISEILETLQNCNRILIEYTYKNSMPARCIYITEKIVVIQIDEVSGNRIRIECFSRDTFESELFENEILENMQASDLLCENNNENEYRDYEIKTVIEDTFHSDVDKLLEDDKTYLIIDQYERGNVEKIKRSIVIKNILSDSIVQLKVGSVNIKKYTKLELLELYK